MCFCSSEVLHTCALHLCTILDTDKKSLIFSIFGNKFKFSFIESMQIYLSLLGNDGNVYSKFVPDSSTLI